ncbi:MAG: hypothetical protein WBG46_13920 [Nonlabens sp.]
MKKIFLSVFALSMMITSCDMKKTESGELPEVDIDVDAEEGNLPEYEINWADIDLKTETRMVEVPKVVVVMEEEEVEVPVLDVDMPDEYGDKRERTLMVEAEVSDKEHNLEIKQIRATGKKLYVISELTMLDTDLGDKNVRVQDQVELNAPELDVEYIIVGERPDRMFNKNNRYVSSMSEVNNMLGDADVIYED